MFDLDAARAQRREAAGEPSEFSFGGAVFTVPPSSEWPLAVRDRLADGDVTDAMAAMLGEQWEAFSALGPTVGDVTDLLDWVAEENGMGSGGKSSASSASATSTPKRSRRTSAATTASTTSTTTGDD